MPVNLPNQQGYLFDFIKVSEMVSTLFFMGLERHITSPNQVKAKKLKTVADYTNPDGIVALNGIVSVLTPINITQFNVNLSQLTDATLDNLLVLLGVPNQKTDFSNHIKSLKAIPSLFTFVDRALAFGVPSLTNSEALLTQLTAMNLPDLLNPVPLLTFLDTNNAFSPSTLDLFIKSMPSSHLTTIIANLVTLSTSMPNFASFSGTLNNTNLTNSLSTNPFCTPCLTAFLQTSGLKTDIMSFLNTQIAGTNSLLNLQLDKMAKDLNIYQQVLAKNSAISGAFNGLLGDIDSLTSSLTTSIGNIPNANQCAPVIGLVAMLAGVKLGVKDLVLKPLDDSINSYNIQIGNILGFTSSLNSLKNLIPRLDC